MAAVLACGPDAALSHGSAAALWRIVPRWPTTTHVTAPSERERTIHPRPQRAQVQRLITPDELTTLLTRYPGRRTAQLTPERGATKSDLEDDFTRFLKRHKLPLPERNQTIAGHEVDAVYRDHHLVIELDSRQFHATPQAFEQDRDRDADLLNAGFPTIRITHHRLTHHAAHEAARLGQILER
jgi:very-short-patch-repair endonuclease